MSAPRRLRTLGKVPAQPHVDLVLLEGLGTTPVEDWAIATQPWLEVLASTNVVVHILAYDHRINVNDKFSLEIISDEAALLIECLREHQQDEPRPLMFMCHSLGCSILKQALCIANTQAPKYSLFLNSTFAIVFLGGPNPQDEKDAAHADSIVAILLAANSKLQKKTLSIVRDGLHLLVNVSRLLKDMQLGVEVLSLFESAPTKVKGLPRKEGKSIFSSSTKVKLVEEQLATIGLPKEQSWELLGDHAELCKLQQLDGKPDARLTKWVQSVLTEDFLTDTLQRIESAHMPESPTVSLTSISSYDAARIALATEPMPIRKDTLNSNSHDATMGSSAGKSWELIPVIKNLDTTRKHATLPCLMMGSVSRNRDFFGREKVLQELETCLIDKGKNSPMYSAQQRSQKHAVVCGAAGIGKTSIAIEFAYAHKDDFDAVFWIRADETAKLEADFALIAGALGLEDPAEHPSGPNPIVSRQLAMGWLTNPVKVLDDKDDILGLTEARWLLIFDNADEPETLMDYWPLGTAGSVLVTSRNPLSKARPSIASESFDLPPMLSDDGVQLLQRLSHSTQETALAKEICKRLGGLPLVISQMAAIIRYQYLTFEDFLEKYDDASSRKLLLAHEEAKAPRREEARGNASTIWAIDRLEEGPRILMQVCSMLDPDCIEERILESCDIGITFMPNYPPNWLVFSSARAELISRSLVTRNEQRKELRVHRVVQDSIKANMGDDQALMVFSLAVALITKVWGVTPLAKRHDWVLNKKREGLFPHARTLRTAFEKLYMDLNPPVSFSMAVLMNEAAWWHHERGNSHESKEFWGLALRICSKNDPVTIAQLLADVHYGLSAAANETNDAKGCLRHTQILLRMRLKIFDDTGMPDIRLAIAHNEIAIAWVMNREYDKGIAAFQESIRIYADLPEYITAIDTNPRTNMGWTYWVIGELDEAWDTLYSLLEDREARFGVDDNESHRTGRVLHGLGNIQYDRGNVTESEQYHERALAHYQRTIGNGHHKTADLFHKMAQHCLRRGELEIAKTFIKQALRTYRLKEEVFAPEIARTTFLRAKVLNQEGETQEATLLFKQARDLRNSIPGVLKRSDAQLREKDFDELVTFFSR